MCRARDKVEETKAKVIYRASSSFEITSWSPNLWKVIVAKRLVLSLTEPRANHTIQEPVKDQLVIPKTKMILEYITNHLPKW